MDYLNLHYALLCLVSVILEVVLNKIKTHIPAESVVLFCADMPSREVHFGEFGLLRNCYEMD